MRLLRISFTIAGCAAAWCCAPAFLNAEFSISSQRCDAVQPYSAGLECYSFPKIGLRCAKPNPCSYFQCPQSTRCLLAETYPAQVACIAGFAPGIPDTPSTSDGQNLSGLGEQSPGSQREPSAELDLEQ